MDELPETYTYRTGQKGEGHFTVLKDSNPYFDVSGIRGPKPVNEFMQRLCERLDAGRMVENAPSPSQAERETADRIQDALFDAECAGYERATGGVQEVFLDEDADDDMGLDASIPLCRIRMFFDHGDDSVGIPSRAYWCLAPDQSGTDLERLLRARPAAPAGIPVEKVEALRDEFETVRASYEEQGTNPHAPYWAGKFVGRLNALLFHPTDPQEPTQAKEVRAATWYREALESIMELGTINTARFMLDATNIARHALTVEPPQEPAQAKEVRE